MARKAKVLSANTVQLDEPEDKGAGLLAELQGREDAEIHVYQNPTGVGQGREAWCFSCGPTDYTWSALLEKIRGDHGGGLYTIRARTGTQWTGRTTLQIAGPTRVAPASSSSTPAAPPAPAAPPVDVMAQFRELQLAQSQQFQQLMLAIIPKLGGQSSSGESVADKLLLLILPEMVKGKTDAIGELKRIMELKQLFTGDGDEGGGGSSTGANGLDVLVKAIDAFGGPLAKLSMMNAAPPAPGPAALPAPAPPGATNGAAGKPALVMRPRAPANPFAQLAAFAMKGATSGSDPKAYAAVLLDQVEPRAAAMLLAQPKPLDALAALVPEAAKHAAWFGELFAALQGGLTARQTRVQRGAGEPPSNSGAQAA